MLAPRLHTIGFNHGMLWADSVMELQDLQVTIAAGMIEREALRTIVYGTALVRRSILNGEWRMILWAPSRRWPWLSNRNEGGFASVVANA